MGPRSDERGEVAVAVGVGVTERRFNGAAL